MREIALLLLAFAVLILRIENHYLHQTIDTISARYADFLQKKVKGQTLIDFISPGTLGIFADKDRTVICGQMNQVIVRPQPSSLPQRSSTPDQRKPQG